MKRHKEPVPSDDTSDTDGNAQVFVLPPDLLEKLGIQLSNIASSTASNEDDSVNQDLKNDLEGIPDNVANSSILETANLMKQSVFMSPTFDTTSETANEHTVANNIIQTAETIEDFKADHPLKTLVDNVQMIENADHKILEIVEDAPSNVASKDFMKYEPLKEYEVDNDSGDLVLTNTDAFYNNTVISGLTRTSPIDEHIDEAYLSDGSYPGTVTEHTNNNSQLATEHQKSNNKIKILSEQIIQNSDLNIIKKTQIHKKGSCFLIPVSTIVTGKVTKDCHNKESNHNIIQDKLYETTTKNTETCSIIKNVSIVNNRLTIKDVDPRSQLMDTDNEVADTDDNSKKMLNKNDDTQNKTNGDISAEETEKVIGVWSNIEESNAENALIKSKLLIQGVEKPGGQCDNVLKTYRRSNKQRRLPEIYHINNTKLEDHNILVEDVQADLDNISISGGNKFCICSDYGRLADYDCDDIYEHLHFHNQSNVVCNLETLLSMYEDALMLDRTEMEHSEMVDDVIEATAYNICWPSMVSEDKDENEDPVLESNMKCQTSSGQPRRSNRKRKSTTEKFADKVEPKPKKTIKCGACGLLLLEAEWNKHKDSAHSLIAWKNDQPIDLKNKELLKKLGQKLKKLGFLRCTFCKKEFKYLTKFVQHVRMCMERKIKSNTSNQDETNENNKQTEKPKPPRNYSRNLTSRTSEPDSKLSPNKKPMPKSLKTEEKDPQKVIDTRHVEVNDTTKSKVSNPKVDIQIKVKSTRTSMLDSMYTSKAEEKDMSTLIDSPKEMECSVRSTRGPTVENKNTFQTNLTDIKKSNDTAKKEENIAKEIQNKNILPAKETANTTDIPKSSKEKDTVKTPKKSKMKVNTPKEKNFKKPEDFSNAGLKTTRSLITDVKDSLEANDEALTKSKASPKSAAKHSTYSKKKSIPEHRNTTTEVTNITSKSTRTSMDESKETPEVKDICQEKVTQKLQMEATLESSRNTSKPSRTKQSTKSQETAKPETEATLKSTTCFNKAEITSKSYSSTDTLMNVENFKSTSKNEDDEKLLENTEQAKCHKKDVTDRASLQSKIKRSPHSKKTSTEVTPTSIKETATGRYKEIDLFSSSCKKNIIYPQKSIITPQKGKSNLNSPKKSGEKSSKPKSSNSTEEISHNLKRKSVDVSGSARTPKTLKDENKYTEATTDRVTEPRSNREISSFNSSVTLDITKNNDKDSNEAPSSAKKPKNTKNPKSDVKSQEVSSSTIRPAATLSKSIEIAASTVKDDNSLANMQIVSANTTTVGNSTATPSNSQSTAAGGASSSNSDQNVNSSSNISSNQTSEGSDKDNPPPVDKAKVIKIKQEVKPKCAVCKQEVDDMHWLEHIAKEHNYLAWRENETPLELEDEEAIRVHLCAIAKRYGELRCFKCNTVRKYARAYRTHVRNCSLNESQLDASTASEDMDTTHDPDDVPLSRCKDEGSQRRLRRSQKAVSSDSVDVTSPNTKDKQDAPLKSRRRSRKVASGPPQDVICAVCNVTVSDDKWIDHIRLEHKYLAWKIGDPPLDVTDDIEVKIFLQNISKHNGGLICSKCGTVRYYVKKWFKHEADCTGDVANESSSSEDIPIAKSRNDKANVIEILPDTVKCGKCGKEMPSKGWTDHIETEHGYLAWIEGHPPLDVNDTHAVNAHLHAIMKKQGALYCAKCGISRKYPKAFLTHISACEISGFKREDFYVEASADVGPDEYECAVCLEKGPKNSWKNHAMSKHYNIAWMAGQIPINLKNPYAVEKYLKEYRMKHNLICKVCGASRTSCYGFYAHILTCGKSESQLENLMSVCDICNNKYLCIYRNQHIQMHREKQKKDEQKEINAIKAEEERKRLREDDGAPMGKRRAAQRAKKVMEKYTSDKPDGNHVCLTCHIGFDNQNLLNDHVCQEPPRGDESDSDDSVKIEGAADESEDDMDVDSCISEEEQDPIRRERKKLPDSSQPKIVLPYKLDNLSRYCEKSFENFCELHYSKASLFHGWRSKEFTMLPEEKASSYLPSLTNSCKVQLADEWYTLMRFEGLKKRDNITLFTGAAIRCMQWVPNNIACDEHINYLSVSCYQHADCPRYGKNELHQHPGLIQIWNMGKFMSTPIFEFGIAHDFGTVWAMDWCPSGGRDLVPTDTDFKGGQYRLGLLGVACSNGSAYILSVPHIRTQVGAEPKICRPKPVAELRISSKPKDILSRTGYQATAISWSPQKGHEIVMVGYSDGTTALYNLNTTSPFLKSMENGVHIFYPFHDALTENSAVTGVSLSASQDLRRVIGGVASSSVTGATMSAWPGAPPVARSHLAASGIAATPNWPAALLCSDDLLTAKATNVLEWWGGGRRFGSACTAGGCARCGRLAVAAPPFVRLMRPHPAYTDLKKQIIATVKMVPLAQKRKLKTDDLGMVVEPLTYDETVKKYGLDFRALPKKNQKPSKLCNAVEQCPERFPLSEMPAVAFCPSPKHHNRLAIATHAGFVFIIIA